MRTEKRCPHWILRSTVVCVACDRRERLLEQADKTAKLPPLLPPQQPRQTVDRPRLDFQPRKPPPRKQPGANEAAFIPGLAIQPALVLVVVSDRYSIDVDYILGPTRYQNVAECRIVCYWLLRELCKLSYPLLGLAMGRDHTTVLYGVKKCERMRETSAAYRELTDGLKRDIEARAKGEVAA